MNFEQDATLSQGGPRDAAVNFGTHIYSGITQFLLRQQCFRIK